MPVSEDILSAFVKAAIWHGDLKDANVLLAAHPDLAHAGIHTAAILGDSDGVRRWLAADPALAKATCPPYGATALACLGLSKYLRLEPARSEGFLRAAAALLDAGADPNGGFIHNGEHETPLYGAAGVAFHAGLTRLLLERGADPNDDEVPYHSPETDDNAALKVLVESGKLTPFSLSMMLLRKTDWHDCEGVRYLLEKGVDPNYMTRWGKTAIHNAALSDNGLDIFEALLKHGANPLLVATHPERGVSTRGERTAVSMAVWRGRGDVLDLFERHGFPLELQGLERLIAACARHDDAAIQALTASEPALVDELRAHAAKLLVVFAGNGNTQGVARLLDLGLPIESVLEAGEGYFGLAPQSTALLSAAWRARHETVKLLLARGASVQAKDAHGQTPLAVAVKACVASHWAYRRTTESIAALLAAGASPSEVTVPTGYPEADALLRAKGSPGA